MGREERAQRDRSDRRGLAALAGIVALAIGVYGGTELYTVTRNARPTVVAYDELVGRPPPAEWLRVTGGALDWPAAFVEKSSTSGLATRVFVPLRGPGWQARWGAGSPVDGTPIRAVVELDGSRARMFGTLGLGIRSVERGDVQGLVRFGVHSGRSARRQMQDLEPAVSDDCILIQSGERPSSMRALVLLGAAAVAGVIAGVFLRGGSSSPLRRRGAGAGAVSRRPSARRSTTRPPRRGR